MTRFYGWRVALACSLVMLVSVGAWFYSFAVFFKPIAAELGWSRAQMSAAMSLMMATWGVTAPLVGWLCDRIGPRRVMAVSSLPFVTSFIGLALAHSPGWFYLFYSLQAAGVTGLTMIPTGTLITRWFLSRRGMAMALAMLGSAAGGLLTAPLAGYLILHIGWRQAYLALGLFAWVTILALLLVIRSQPSEMGLAAGGPASPSTPWGGQAHAHPRGDWNLSRALRSSLLWKLTAALALMDLGVLAIYTHQVNFLTDKGIDPLIAATALGVTSAMEGVGKIAVGLLADRFGKIQLALLCLALEAGAVFVLVQATNAWMLWVFVLFFGAGTGGVVLLRPLLVGEFFGATSFGGIYGVLESARRGGAVAGPIIAGAVYDAFSSYDLAFALVIGSLLLAGAFLLSLRKAAPKRP